MTTALLTLTLTTLLAGDPPSTTKPREPNPFAPSLPLLTDEEEARLDEIIDRFIKYDSGQLAGADARKARQDFERLGPEAIPALIRGLNEAAKIEHSCPAVLIAKKLYRMLMATDDTELLQFARENVGAGITESRHMAVLRDLRLACTLRKNQLARLALAGPKPPRALTTAELVRAAGSERGARLKQVLTELEQRRGDDALNALGVAAASYETDVRDLARELLPSNLSRQGSKVVKAKLKDERSEVRAAAAQAVAAKFPALGGDVIDLLGDDDAAVRDAAHKALVRLNRGTDLGPAARASDSERAAAVEQWRAWWAKQGGR
jgi:hypothetical protein